MTPALKTREEAQPADEPQRIALDMDGVLAHTKARVWDLLGYDIEPRFMTHWDWPQEVFGSDFLDAFEDAWTFNYDEIEPCEFNLDTTTAKLAEDYTVDVVTAQPSERCGTDGKRWWLNHFDITYNDLVTVSVDETKADLDYDVFIDDKPSLPGQINRYNPSAESIIIDKPYNRQETGADTRVRSVRQAVTYLYDNVGFTDHLDEVKV